jgi:hypothetical protein
LCHKLISKWLSGLFSWLPRLLALLPPSHHTSRPPGLLAWPPFLFRWPSASQILVSLPMPWAHGCTLCHPGVECNTLCMQYSVLQCSAVCSHWPSLHGRSVHTERKVGIVSTGYTGGEGRHIKGFILTSRWQLVSVRPTGRRAPGRVTTIVSACRAVGGCQGVPSRVSGFAHCSTL